MDSLLKKFDNIIDAKIGKTFLTPNNLPYKYIRTTPVSNEKVEIEIEINFQRIIFRSNIALQK